jgi:hypothetical protein
MQKNRPFSNCFEFRVWWFCVLSLTAIVASTSVAAGRDEVTTIQQTIDELKARLSIDVEVTVAIIPRNPLLVSVERIKTRKDAFELAFDQDFLEMLSDDERRAAIAHELGHVWIFTHHPYLQTERLANEIAMRAVSRSSLEKMYAKVWARDGTKGDLTSFLGEQ